MTIRRSWFVYAVVVMISGGSAHDVQAQPSAGVDPRACTSTTIATGGTAVTVIAGPLNGGFIYNPVSATSQGIGAAENLYVDMVATPGSTDAAGIGTTATLSPGQNFPLPMISGRITVKANAATSGHRFTAECW